MTTIDLLPPEIREKRVAERRRVLVVMGMALAWGSILAVGVFLGVMVGAENAKLAQLENRTAGINRAIAEYQIFEKQKQDVDSKKAIVAQAIAGEVPWFKMLNEVALIIPSDVWLTTFSGDEKAGVQFTAQATDMPADTPDLGHKPVAKWLVRLEEIPMLADIWLVSSTKANGTVTFSTSAKVTLPSSPAAAPAPPGPPTGGGP
jgi:Tfp pilus assembly protein PilN